MIGTLFSLAFAGIRSRLFAGILTIILTAAAAATIILTLEIGSTISDPWKRTFEAANGAHVFATVPTEADARSVARLTGVADSDEPIPFTKATMIVNGEKVDVFLAGLDGRPRINVPVLTEGTEVTAGGAVLERSLARALGISVGSDIGFQSATGPNELEVVGTAISPSQPRYPRSNPGIAWVTRQTLEQIEPIQSDWHWFQSVRLADPLTAPAFAEAATMAFPPETVSIESWQDQRAIALQEADPIRIILTMYTLLLLIVSYAVIAILIGARVSSQYREIALMKAIGLTPRQVSAVFVVEAVALGFLGIVIGFIPGALLAPRLAAPSTATLLASPSIEANPSHILVASFAIMPVIILSAYVSARRSAHAAVMEAIRSGMSIPASRSRMARILSVADMPIPIELGLKDLLARRSRAIWLMSAIAVTSAAMIVTLSVQAALNARPEGKASDVPTELPTLIFTLDAVLALITLSALAGIALLSVRERIRDFGVLRTIGLTQSEVASTLAGSHAALAFFASIVSIPLGLAMYLGLYRAASGESGGAIAPWWWLAIVPITITVGTAIATSVPARLAARIPTSDAVRYE
jgi:putative ABC transport system permease protein